MDINFLKRLANSTKGNYYSIENYNGLKNQIERLTVVSSKDKLSNAEIDLWSNEWIMLIIIILFAVEWIVRKREGML